MAVLKNRYNSLDRYKENLMNENQELLKSR